MALVLAAPVFSVGETVTTKDSITIKWQQGSEYTDYFLVYGRRIMTARRDLPTGNFTLLMNSTSNTYTATSLASGATYEFSIHAVTADGISTNHATFTFQTTSVAENQEFPPGGTAARRHSISPYPLPC